MRPAEGVRARSAPIWAVRTEPVNSNLHGLSRADISCLRARRRPRCSPLLCDGMRWEREVLWMRVLEKEGDGGRRAFYTHARKIRSILTKRDEHIGGGLDCAPSANAQPVPSGATTSPGRVPLEGGALFYPCAQL